MVRKEKKKKCSMKAAVYIEYLGVTNTILKEEEGERNLYLPKSI